MSRSNKSLVTTIIISGFSVIISYLINFFLTPFITDTVGTEAYGFITLAKTAVSYVSIITIAFTAFMVRYITLEYHKKNFDNSRAYFSSAIVAVMIITGAVVVISGIAISFLNKLINIPSDLVSTVKVLFALVFLNFCVSTISIPFSSACYIKNKLTLLNSIKILSYIIEAIILILLFKVFKTQLWYVGVGLLGASVTILIGNVFISKKLTPELYFTRNQVSISKVKDLAQNGIWQSVNSMGAVLNSGLDLWITNIMLSPLAMGQISIAKTIGMMFSVLYSTVSQAFQPRMLKIYASDNKQAFLKELQFAMKVSGFFSCCAFAGFFALGQLYYKLWLPNQDYRLIYTLTIVTILSSVADGVIYPTFFVNTLTTKKKIPCFVTIGTGVLNVTGMFFLLQYTNLGVYAVVWTTAVLSFLTSFVFNPIYCAVTLKLPWNTLFPLIIRHLMSCAIMTAVFVFITKIIEPSTWTGLILSAGLLIIIGTGIYVAILSNKEDRKKILNKVKSIRTKYK